jgi:hypothetical protein
MSSLDKPVAQMLPFSSISNHANLRCDAKYRLFWGITGDALYPTSTVPCYPIRLATVPHRIKKAKKGSLSSEFELIELEDVEKRTGYVISSSPVTEIQSDKLVFGDADILTTRLRPYLGKTILNDRRRPLLGTTEWIPIKVANERLHPTLLKYFLLSSVYIDNAERLLSGKEHPRVAESDILSLRVPFFDHLVQSRLVNAIENIEREIAQARQKIRPEQDVINEVLCAAFRYPLSEHLGRARVHQFRKPLHAMVESFMLRNSTRFHHPHFEIVENYFDSIKHVRVKHFLAIPIKLGATAKKADLLESGGEAYYVHPGATKRQGVIALEDCYQISEKFYEENRRRAGLKPGDIIINRSGEAHGKVAFFESDAPAVASDFTMRVRVSERANPKFLWFFFRSVMFQAQISREMRGASVANIFPSGIQQMFVVECSRAKQDTLERDVSVELDKVRRAKERVNSKQSSIHALIEKAILKTPH